MPAEETALKPWRSYKDVYDRDDPRAYFRTLEPLGYRQPEVLAGFFAERGAVIAKHLGKERLTLLDFGCGYGVFGAVLRHGLLMQDLYAYFAEDADLAADRAFFARNRSERQGPVIGGLDIAASAVAYAEACGLIDRGFTENLTEEAPGAALAAFFQTTDIVVETGAVYNHVPACYARLLAGGGRPWMLFGPRGDADTRPLLALLGEHGYVIEEASRQRRRYRRFSDPEEAVDSEANMRQLDRDLALESRRGWFLNPLLLARPRAEAAALPIEVLAF